jgi:hypothetical protein
LLLSNRAVQNLRSLSQPRWECQRRLALQVQAAATGEALAQAGAALLAQVSAASEPHGCHPQGDSLGVAWILPSDRGKSQQGWSQSTTLVLPTGRDDQDLPAGNPGRGSERRLPRAPRASEAPLSPGHHGCHPHLRGAGCGGGGGGEAEAQAEAPQAEAPQAQAAVAEAASRRRTKARPSCPRNLSAQAHGGRRATL